jgi:hypothetical protein
VTMGELRTSGVVTHAEANALGFSSRLCAFASDAFTMLYSCSSLW